MNKLGNALGVMGLSLYNYVDSKDDLLRGIVDLLWSRVDDPPEPPRRGRTSPPPSRTPYATSSAATPTPRTC